MAEALRELVAGFQFAKGMADVLSSFQGPSKSGERETAPTADIAPPGMFPAFGTKARAAMEQDGTLLVHWGDVLHPDATVYKYPPSAVCADQAGRRLSWRRRGTTPAHQARRDPRIYTDDDRGKVTGVSV
jgi:hypothetical protein